LLTIAQQCGIFARIEIARDSMPKLIMSLMRLHDCCRLARENSEKQIQNNVHFAVVSLAGAARPRISAEHESPLADNSREEQQEQQKQPCAIGRSQAEQ